MRTDFMGKLKNVEYLGDAVYCGHDGYHIFIWVEGTPIEPGVIGLEPPVLKMLDRYRERHFGR